MDTPSDNTASNKTVTGISIAVSEQKLSKVTRLVDGAIQPSQVKALEAYAALARQAYNWVTALYSEFLEMKDDFISVRILGYANQNPQLAHSLAVGAKVLRADSGKNKKVKLEQDDLIPLTAEDIKRNTITDKKNGTVISPSPVTVKQALDFAAARDGFFKEFKSAHSFVLKKEDSKGQVKEVVRSPGSLFVSGGLLDYVHSQIVGTTKDPNHAFNGKVLYDSYKDANPLPSWFLDIVNKQEAAHPLFRHDPSEKAIAVTVGEGSDAEVIFVPRRVAVNEIKNAAAAVKKHHDKFFSGGNIKQGKPRFRKMSGNQTFAISVPTSGLVIRHDTSAKAKKKFIETYDPNSPLSAADQKAQREERWAAEVFLRKSDPSRIASSSRLYFGGALGSIPLSRHGVKNLLDAIKEGGTLATDIRFTRKGGKWSVGISVTRPDGWKRERPASYYLGEKRHVGVDVGVIDAVVLDSGFALSNISRNERHAASTSSAPRTRQEQHFARALSHEQSSFERLRALESNKKQWQVIASESYEAAVAANGGERKGARMFKRWYEAQGHVRRINRQITNIRSHHRNVIAKIVASNFDIVGVENLNTSGMIAKVLPKTDDANNFIPNGRKAKSGLARAISAVGFHDQMRLIKEKAGFYGTTVQEIDCWYASSKLCSECGAKKAKSDLPLSVREYHCDKCGYTAGRDENAARNIIKEALRIYEGGSAKDTPIDKEPLAIAEEYYLEVAKAKESLG